MRVVFIIFLFSMALSAQLYGQSVPNARIVQIDWYKKLRQEKNDTTYVLNFWATWCMPCLEELPDFEQFSKETRGGKIKVILVSLDFVQKYRITLLPYLQSKNIQSEVVLLNEPDYNAWLDVIDKKWQGSIPATQVFNQALGYYYFHEGILSHEDLRSIYSKID